MQHRSVIVLLICIFFATLPTPAFASAPEAQSIPGVANETPEARQLAMERWEFVNRLAREAGFYLSKSLEAEDTALFPVGKSDRVYLLCVGPSYVTGGQSDAILCYQTKNGQDKLVYKIPIIDVLSPPTKDYPPKSLLEYITSHGMGESYVTGNQSIDADGSLAIQVPISIYEYNDLSAKRNYVEYGVVPPIFCLDVSLLSDTGSAGELAKKEEIDLGFGQNPKGDRDSEKFYPRYGLPVIKEEEALIAGGNGTRNK